MEALAPSIALICELPDKYAESITVTSVSISHKEGNWGATITGLKTLEKYNSPLVINTPHLPVESYSENNPNDENILPDETIDLLKVLFKEAEEFIKGKRKQLNLFENKAS